MRPKKIVPTNKLDLYRSRLEQIINSRHELVQLAGKLDWTWIDGQIAPLFAEQGRPAVPTRFMIGLLLLKHIHGLSDEEVCERWVENPYFQHFTGEEFFQHEFPHDRSGLSHWRRRLGNKLELLLAETLRVAHDSGALRTRDLARVTVDTTVQEEHHLPDRRQAGPCRHQGAEPPGQPARGAAAAVLSAHRQAGRLDGRPLCSRQAI